MGEAWANTQAAAEILEETKKTLIAQLSLQCNEKSIAAKEMFAYAHPDYTEHLQAMNAARKDANKHKVRYESAKVWAELKRTEAANERAANRSAM